MNGLLRWPIKLGLVVAALLGAVSLVEGFRNALQPKGSQDNQWGPSRALLFHQDPYRLSLQHHDHPETPKPFILSQDPTYPASGLVMLWPYAILPWPTAKVVWAVLNVLFTVIIVTGLFQLFLPAQPRWLLVLIICLFVAGTPHRNLIGNGQQALFVLSFFVLSLMFLEKGYDVVAGICLAVSLFKYTVTVPLLPYFLVKRRWNVVLLALGIHVALTLFLAAWVHTSPFDLLLGPVRVAFVVSSGGYVDFRAVLGQLGWTSWKYLWACAACIVLAAATLICRYRGRGQELLTLSVLAVASMVLFFHLAYDAVVLIFPLFHVLSEKVQKRGRDPLVILLALCVGLSWYVDKFIFVLNEKAPSPFVQQLSNGYHWLVIVLYYGTLACGLYLLYTRGSRAEAGSPTPAPE